MRIRCLTINYHLPVCAGSLLLLAVAARAQVDVTLTLKYRQTLPYEATPAICTIHNGTSKPLLLRPETPESALRFDIRDERGRVIPPRGNQDGPMVMVGPRETAQIDVNLSEFYNLRHVGGYTIRADVDWHGLSFISNKAYLDVVRGLEIFRTIEELDGRYLTLRLIALQRKPGSYLMLALDDEAAAESLGVVSLGRFLHFMKPQIVVDRNDVIHVLHQAGPSQVIHNRISAVGEKLGQESYAGPVMAMKLHMDEEGVSVEGAEMKLEFSADGTRAFRAKK